MIQINIELLPSSKFFPSIHAALQRRLLLYCNNNNICDDDTHMCLYCKYKLSNNNNNNNNNSVCGDMRIQQIQHHQPIPNGVNNRNWSSAEDQRCVSSISKIFYSNVMKNLF